MIQGLAVPLQVQVTSLFWDMLLVLVQNFHLVIIGVLIGMFVGILPGMGGAVALSLIIPFTFEMSPQPAFILLGAALGATTMSGSLTAILVNTPGSGSNAATILDGYPLTRQGRGKEAIGASATASAAGATVGLFLFLLIIPLLREIALFFGSIEIFWLAIFGIAIIPSATQGSLNKGLIAGALGLMFAFHGYSIISGVFRFEYIRVVSDGIQLVPAMIGLFAIAEMLNLASRGETISKAAGEDDPDVDMGGSILAGVKSVVTNKWVFLRSAVIGFIVGSVPGAGGSVANFVAYVHAAQLRSGDKIPFGEGNIVGVIASESSNDSKDGGQLIPTFGLGIPGGTSTAILLGAFLFHGFTPGPQFINEQLDIVLLVMLALLASNILTSIIGIGVARWAIIITRLDIEYLFPTIMAFALFGSYIIRNSFGDVAIAVLFGILGLAFIAINVTRVPIVIALVLGEIVESNFHRGLSLGDGDPLYFVNSPLAAILVVIIALSVFYPIVKRFGLVPSLSVTS